MNKVLKIILIVLCAMLVLAAVFSGDDADEATKSETTPETVETATPTIGKSEFASIVDSELDKNFAGYNHTTKWDGDTLVINIWADGLAMGAVLAINGDAECAESWESMRNANSYLCETIRDAAAENGLNIHVILNILNEENLDNCLLSIADGITIYNAVG